MRLCTMSDLVNSKKPPTWDGKKNTVAVFMERFTAHAEDQNFGEALEFGAEDLPASAKSGTLPNPSQSDEFTTGTRLSTLHVPGFQALLSPLTR